MAKATHEGTCQCCGSFQKLPSGVLSKHGYTVDWGYFSGVCQGAGKLPFEQSKDLIEHFIVGAKARAQELLVEVKELRESTDASSVWKNSYREGIKYQSGSFFWEQREIKEITKKFSDGEEYYVYEWFYSEDEPTPRHKRNNEVGGWKKSLEEVVKEENENYVNKLLKHVSGLNTYVEWQEERIKNWKPKELEAIAKTYSGPKVHVVNARDIRIEDGMVKYKGRQHSGCGRSQYFSKVSEFEKTYKESPEKCCKGCVKRFLEIKEVIKQRKEEALAK